jgi:hypothetical protein
MEKEGEEKFTRLDMIKAFKMGLRGQEFKDHFAEIWDEFVEFINYLSLEDKTKGEYRHFTGNEIKQITREEAQITPHFQSVNGEFFTIDFQKEQIEEAYNDGAEEIHDNPEYYNETYGGNNE